MTTEGFEPSPLRNSALNYRLRPLGQIVIANFIPILFEYKFILINKLKNIFKILDMHKWSSGRIVDCNAIEPGTILGL